MQIGRPLLSLVTLPVLFNSLDQSALGVWMITLSMLGILNFVGSGISSSIVTHVGRASAMGDRTQIGQLATAGFLIAAICAAGLALVALPVALLVDWTWLLGLEDAALGRETSRLIAAMVVVLGLSFIAVIPRQVMFGRLHGSLAHILDLLGLALGAVGLVAALLGGAPLWVTAVLFVGPPIALVFIGGLFYLARAGIVAFAPRSLDRGTLKLMGRDALRMSVYQLTYTISSQTDLILIGVVLGSASTVAFGLAQRVFSLLVVIGYAFNQAQWPALARADAAGDHAVLMPLFRRTLLVVPVVATLSALLLAWAYDPLVRLWLGASLETDRLLLCGMVAWVFVATAANTCDSLLRARNETGLLMREMAIMAVLNLATTLALMPHLGAAGAIWGSVIGYLVAVLLPYVWFLRGVIFGARA